MQGVLKKIFTIPGIIFFLIVLINLYFSAWFAMNGEINFHTDVARDFLLYQEIEDKKVILIGPRSSTSGLFHGPTWLYLTYPGYFLGNGNPAIMGWYWLVLIVLFLLIGFSVARSLFGNTAAWIYTVLLSGNMIFYASNLFNPHGALFLIPIFLYSIIRYHETVKFKFLVLHLSAAALIIQFQMAVGIPLTILSIIYLLIFKIRRGTLKHLLAFIIFFGLLGNFLIFEIRHDFIMTKAITDYVKPLNASGNRFDYSALFIDRIDQMMSVQLTQAASSHISGALFTLIVFFIIIQIRNRKYKHIYLLLSYFYVGYILLTFVNKGVVLHHQSLPMLALTNLVFASFVTMKSKKIFIPVLIFLVFLNTSQANWYTGYQKELFLGKHQNS